MFCAGIGLFRLHQNKLQVCLARTHAKHESMLKGKIEKKINESVLDCAYRETKEESGVTPDMIRLFDSDTVYFVENSIKYFVGIFNGPDTFVPHPDNPEELDSTNWHNVDDVIKYDDFTLKRRRREIINEMSKLVSKYYQIPIELLDNSQIKMNDELLDSFDKSKQLEQKNTTTENVKFKNPKKVFKKEFKKEFESKSEPKSELNKADIRLSKTMSKVLRHHLHDSGLKIYKDESGESDGSVNFTDFAKYMRASEDSIRKVVDNNEKKRFSIINRNGINWIRANQGHSEESGSMISDSALLKEITTPYDFCAHGTYKQYIDLIKKNGLNRMSRKHIHMIKCMDAISGFRKSSEILIHINMKAAIDDGIVFYESDNNVILTEGVDGVLDPKYFTKFENL